ncbi:MAG: hypothetical protein IT257_09655 [Chitinophagaceae bacterium]|nr:hypothetical protein [Chitinophagaceae bacterium]
MERNSYLVLYRLVLLIGTFLLTNFAIGTEQLKVYYFYFCKESTQLIHFARRILKLKELFNH